MARRPLRDDVQGSEIPSSGNADTENIGWNEEPPMKRTWMILMMCAALATPMMAGAGDQTIPPEAHWTSTPPMRSTVDVNQLASMLVEKGMISPHEYSQLAHPQAPSPSQSSHGRAWSWDEIEHNPVRSSGGD
jgi:hypothetical protein